MALLAAAQDAGPAGFASTARHVALGKMAEGGRWVGSKAAAIDKDLVRTSTESTEGGKILDLNFHFKFVQEMSGLSPYAPHLQSLDLSYNNLRSIEGLEGMARLRELKLYGCQISRISGLEACASLMSLHLDDNCISTVEGLDALKCLEYLNLESNKVQKLGRGLAKLSKLRELHLSRNRLTTLDGVAGLGNLEVLSASFNQIRKIGPEQVKGLTKLDEFRLEGNLLVSLSFLIGASGSAQPLPCLATLDVSGNQITSEALAGLPCLPQLAELSLAGNNIADIPSCVAESWQSLEILDLSRNQLERPEQLERLKQLTSLRELALEGNPVASLQDEELSRVVGALGALEYLDDRPLPAPAPALMAIEGEVEDEKTFALTASRVALGGSSRPSTSSRPATSSTGRPGTSQGLKEAGVKEPLMHARLQFSERRYATEEQVAQWEKQTMTGLAAIERQIVKTEQLVDREFAHMDRCVQKAHKVMERQRELQAQGILPPLPEPGSAEEALMVEEASREPTPSTASGARSSPPSRLGRKLREVVDGARVEGDADVASTADEAETLASQGGAKRPPPLRKESRGVLPAACDEEVLEEQSASRPGSCCGTDAEDDDEPIPAQVLTEAEEEPATPAAVPRRSKSDLHFGPRTSVNVKKERRRAPAAAAGARGRPPLARVTVR